jgi:hypothetical protein
MSTNKGEAVTTHATVLRLQRQPTLEGGTLLLAFNGWMDGGDVSNGTVQRLVDLLGAEPFAEIDADPFYVLHFPGPMEVNAMFWPTPPTGANGVTRMRRPR